MLISELLPIVEIHFQQGLTLAVILPVLLHCIFLFKKTVSVKRKGEI